MYRYFSCQDISQIINLFTLHLAFCNQIFNMHCRNWNCLISFWRIFFFPSFVQGNIVCYSSCSVDYEVIIKSKSCCGTDDCTWLYPLFLDVWINTCIAGSRCRCTDRNNICISTSFFYCIYRIYFFY